MPKRREERSWQSKQLEQRHSEADIQSLSGARGELGQRLRPACEGPISTNNTDTVPAGPGKDPGIPWGPLLTGWSRSQEIPSPALRFRSPRFHIGQIHPRPGQTFPSLWPLLEAACENGLQPQAHVCTERLVLRPSRLKIISGRFPDQTLTHSNQKNSKASHS